MISCGIDIGSLSTDVVLIKDNKIMEYVVIPTSSNSEIAAKTAFDMVLDKANVKIEDISSIISTGYGRYSTPLAQKPYTEITCHAIGAKYFLKDVKTVIDVGGQDSKIIKISDKGKVEDFLMNDKCAAGTGRFVEVMARSLDVELFDVGALSLTSKSSLKINATCTVFAESEIVALVSQNIPKHDILKGICSSIASRLYSMILRIQTKGPYIMTGGVAKNIGVKVELERLLGEEIYVPFEPQIVGAVGAALINS